MTGELSNSLSEIRKETHSWKTKWRHVFVNHKPESSTVVCCHERELCGFVHGDGFIFTGDSVQLMWIESRLKEGLNLERCANQRVDDGVDKTVTILSQLVTWSNQTGILLARMSMDGFDICVVLCCADKHIKKFDCTNESGVRKIRERRYPGVHSRQHRELSDGRGSDEGHEFGQLDDFPGR